MNYELQKELNAALKNLLQCSREFYENSNPRNYVNLLKKKTHAIHDCDCIWRKIFKAQYPFRTLCGYCDSPEHNEIEHVCPARHSDANFWKNPPEGVSFYPKKLMIMKTHNQYAEKNCWTPAVL